MFKIRQLGCKVESLADSALERRFPKRRRIERNKTSNFLLWHFSNCSYTGLTLFCSTFQSPDPIPQRCAARCSTITHSKFILTESPVLINPNVNLGCGGSILKSVIFRLVSPRILTFPFPTG